jgi:hypothetical protein
LSRRRRAVSAWYGPDMWNVYELVLNTSQRTINEVEEWHSQFKKMDVTDHESVQKFLEHIQKDQRENMKF